MSLRAISFCIIALALISAIVASSPKETLTRLKHLTRSGRQEEAVSEFKQHLTDNGSNFKCTICVVVFTIVKNEIGDSRKDIEQLMSKVCDYLPPRYNATVRL